MLVGIYIITRLCENFTYLISINKGIRATTQGAHTSLIKNSLVSSIYLLVKSIEDEIPLSTDHMNTTRGRTQKISRTLLINHVSMDFNLY